MKSFEKSLIDQMLKEEEKMMEKLLFECAAAQSDKGVELTGLLKVEINLN
jgi:hypothetical protein